jgi:hypothetical protein
MSPTSKVMGGFPSRMPVTLKYVDAAVVLNPAAGSVDVAVFSLRNLFDPDQRVGGHQPSNFDRWSVIYGRYTVVRTRVKISWNFDSTSSTAPFNFGFLISKSGAEVTGFSSPGALMEQPYCKYLDSGSSNGVAAMLSPALTATVPSLPWLGMQEGKVDREILFSDGFSADISSAPAEDVYSEFWCWAVNGNDPIANPFKVELEYDAVFFQPKVTLPS